MADMRRGKYVLLPGGGTLFLPGNYLPRPRQPFFRPWIAPFPVPQLPHHGGGVPNPAHIPPRQGATGKPPTDQHTHTGLPYDQIAKAGAKAYKLFKDRGHFSHDLSKLVERGCENLENKKMSKYQAQGLTSLQKSMHPGGPKNGSSFMSSSGLELAKDWSASDESVIMKFYKQFDQLFFFGTLDARCSWEIDWNHDPGLLGLCTTAEEIGYNTQVGAASPHYRSRIRLSKLHGKDRQKRLIEYIGTLLHEMCHAFMTIWSCEARSCWRQSDRVGATGHGDAWQDTCLAVELAAKKHLKLKLTLGRLDSYARELAATGAAPSKSCSRWGFDIPKLNRLIARVKGGA